MNEKTVSMQTLSPLMEEMLRRGETVDFTVTGNSMRPMLLHGISRVRLSVAGELKKGDLPLYRRKNGTFVFHRIIGTAGDTYICCGDNQGRKETGVSRESVIGVMTAFARKNRWRSVDSISHVLYWRVWLLLRPLRAVLEKVRIKIGNISGNRR